MLQYCVAVSVSVSVAVSVAVVRLFRTNALSLKSSIEALIRVCVWMFVCG